MSDRSPSDSRAPSGAPQNAVGSGAGAEAAHLNHHWPDEFAPHWSAVLSADGTLSVTFEIATTLTEVPDAGLVDLLRAALLAQREGDAIPLNVIVGGAPTMGAVFASNVRIHTVCAELLLRAGYAVRDVDDWELRDRNGTHIDGGCWLNEVMASGLDTSLLWLNHRAGWGS